MNQMEFTFQFLLLHFIMRTRSKGRTSPTHSHFLLKRKPTMFAQFFVIINSKVLSSQEHRIHNNQSQEKHLKHKKITIFQVLGSPVRNFLFPQLPQPVHANRTISFRPFASLLFPKQFSLLVANLGHCYLLAFDVNILLAITIITVDVVFWGCELFVII